MAREAREKPLSVNERDFLLQALREEKRVDGRRPFDMRMLKISVGPALGEVTVLLGQTRVYCVVSADLSEPQPQRPTEGFFHFNTEFSPMASPAFESGRPSESAIELGRIVERGLRESKAIDSEALCIVAGVKVWDVHVNIFVLDHNGNLIDCASIAAVTALLHFRRPEVAVNGDVVTVFKAADKEPVPLSIHHIPIAITFGLFDGGAILIVDPSLKEELAMDGRITLTLNVHREICAVQKSGGTPQTVSQVMQCAKVAAVKVAEVTAAVQAALKSSRDIKIISKPIDLSEIVPQMSMARIVESSKEASKKKAGAGAVPQVFTSEETYFEGGATAWAVKDNDTVSALTPEEQTKLSKQASSFLAELTVNLNQTPSGDADMAESSALLEVIVASSQGKKDRKDKKKGSKIADDEEEDTVQAVMKMDEVVEPANAPKQEQSAATSKKSKAPEPSPAPRTPITADVGTDLAMALKKKPKKAGAATK